MFSFNKKNDDNNVEYHTEICKKFLEEYPPSQQPIPFTSASSVKANKTTVQEYLSEMMRILPLDKIPENMFICAQELITFFYAKLKDCQNNKDETYKFEKHCDLAVGFNNLRRLHKKAQEERKIDRNGFRKPCFFCQEWHSPSNCNALVPTKCIEMVKANNRCKICALKHTGECRHKYNTCKICKGNHVHALCPSRKIGCPIPHEILENLTISNRSHNDHEQNTEGTTSSRIINEPLVPRRTRKQTKDKPNIDPTKVKKTTQRQTNNRPHDKQIKSAPQRHTDPTMTNDPKMVNPMHPHRG